jgi:hypothetical protein
VIVNSAKSSELNFFATLKWPLITEVESSIVFKKVDKLVAASSLASMYIAVAEETVALLNLTFPVPGSDAVVALSKV